MLQSFLKQRNYPFILFLGIPENNLDLLSFILFISYCILKYIFTLSVWCNLLIAIVFFLITLIFNKHNINNQYKWSINHTRSFSIFFAIWFLLEIF